MMDSLHNGEPLPSSLHNSSNNDQPQEHLAADDVKMSPSTNDPQSVGNEVTIRANAPSTEEPTYVQKTSTDEDTIRQESTQQTAASTEETTNSTSNEPTIIIAPAQIKLSPLSNEAPTQEASPAGQDINGTPQPLTNPGPSPYPLGGTWQNPPGGTWQNPPPGMWSGYQQPVSTRPPKPLSRLARPLPLWALLGGIVLIIGLLVALHLTGSDWGQGAANASRAAVYIGIILVVVLILRSLNWQNSSGMASSLNPTRVRQYIVSLLCIIVIFVYSGVSQALVPTLHIAQGRSQEGQRQWQTALNEYQLGGEKAPDGKDMARVYTSWGLALNKAQRYNEAIAKFAIVIRQFDSSTTRDQVKQAQSGDIAARLAVAQQSMGAKNYVAATGSYDTMLGLTYCDTTCTNQVNALDATAYYNLGETQLQTQDYTSAVTSFDVVLTKFADAPEAKQLHGDMAKALMGEGQNARAVTCTSAVQTYQRLANEYGDTPEGQSAMHDLNAPQTIKGTFSNSNTSDALYHFTQMGLTHGLHGGMSSDDVFNAWDSATLKTDIQSNGDFSFSGMAQGDYDLFWSGTEDLGSVIYQKVEFIYSPTTSQPTYVAHVGPLCPVDMGKVSNSTLSFSY